MVSLNPVAGLGGLTPEELKAAANVKDRGKINEKHQDVNRISNRSTADGQRDVSVMKDLSKEFGLKDEQVDSWLKKAAESDEVNVYDKNGKKIDGTTKDQDGMIFEINSKEHGRVVVRYGADGALDGYNDAIVSMGGQATAQNAQAGLTQATGQGAAKEKAQGAANQALPAALNQQDGINGLGNLGKGGIDIDKLIAAIMAQLNQLNI